MIVNVGSRFWDLQKSVVKPLIYSKINIRAQRPCCTSVRLSYIFISTFFFVSLSQWLAPPPRFETGMFYLVFVPFLFQHGVTQSWAAATKVWFARTRAQWLQFQLICILNGELLLLSHLNTVSCFLGGGLSKVICLILIFARCAVWWFTCHCTRPRRGAQPNTNKMKIIYWEMASLSGNKLYLTCKTMYWKKKIEHYYFFKCYTNILCAFASL